MFGRIDGAQAAPDRHFSGVVEYASPIVDPDSRTVTVKARVRNDQGLLKPGMSATANVSTRVLQGAAVVPEVAIRREAGEEYVFRLAADTVSRVGVTLGPRPRPGDIVIVGGPTPGDTVLIAGFQKVTTGSRVQAATETAQTASARTDSAASPGAAGG